MRTPQVPPVFEAPTLHRAPTVYTEPEARKAARTLQDGDSDGWTYEAVDVGGSWRVRVTDEGGHVLGDF